MDTQAWRLNIWPLNTVSQRKTSYFLSSQRIGFILILFGFIWGMYLVYMTGQQRSNESEVLKEQIIALSKKYIETLAKEKSFSEADTVLAKTPGNKHTTALLLKNMLDRIQHLEKELNFIIVNSTLEFAKMSKSIATLNSTMTILTGFNRSGLYLPMSLVKCEIPNDPEFPDCRKKVLHLKDHWNQDPKYALAGVNGSLCSVLLYLSQIESWCPTNFPADLIVVKDSPPEVHAVDNGCAPINSIDFPTCIAKVEWLRHNWRIGHHYTDQGVDGSSCSFMRYLSEVEHHCPRVVEQQVDEENSTCTIPTDTRYPHCKLKVAWMRSSWKTHPCYAKKGVDGTLCTFLIYLSEVEDWCPLLPGRTKPTEYKKEESPGNRIPPMIEGRNLEDLLTIVSDSDQIKLTWIRGRISRLWSEWEAGLKQLKGSRNITDYSQKKILIYIGLLADESNFHFGKSATQGGPLGELVQWSDIITSLYLLGHDVKVIVSKETAKSLMKTSGLGSPCPSSTNTIAFDIIYLDYIGLLHLKRAGTLSQIKCRLRVIDSFGTEAQFNHLTDVKLKSTFTGQDLDLQQYNTMFPHSPDNTFLGFVVENHLKPNDRLPEKKPIALVYGKHINMWKDSKRLKFLDIVQKYFEIHATVGGKNGDEIKLTLPSYVKNHGILSGPDLQGLLQTTKVFIGLGFPYEGPAPLEAIANGCRFINAKLVPSQGRTNTVFFKAKPTFRMLTSQHPYAETFIGKPYVYTLDLTNLTSIDLAMQEIKNTKIKPYLPREFSYVGMLERLYVLTKSQHFCQSNNVNPWPPLKSRQVVVSLPLQSCKDACLSSGLICEPSYFPTINKQSEFNAAQKPCKKSIKVAALHNPSILTGDETCELQQSKLLFSCTAVGPKNIQRLCPCRDFIHGQTALCKDCL